jgi:hypothetical protein
MNRNVAEYVSQCPSCQLVKAEHQRLAGHKLDGEASYWWKFNKVVLAEELGLGVSITWDRLMREFNDQFFPRIQQQQCAQEFQDLKQGRMSIEQYSAKFLKLLRYVPHLIPDEQTKVEIFLDGLSSRIKERFTFLEITSYSKMLHTTTIPEKQIREVGANYVSMKQSMSIRASPPPPPSKRQSSSSSFGSFGRISALVSHGNFSITQCSKYGKPHSGECHMRTRACFQCDRVGHYAKDCCQTFSY